MNNTYLTIIIPCFNEKKTILEIINQLRKIKNIKKQIILVDDGSTDGTRDLIKKKLKNKVDKVIFHKKNMGKGSAIISSIKFIKGNLIIIQDADLEYSPTDYHKLIKPFLNYSVKAVYGSRVLGRRKNPNLLSIKNFPKNFRIFGNYILTKFSNFINKQSLTDVHTCYKVFRKDIFLSLNLKEKDFAFCIELPILAKRLGNILISTPSYERPRIAGVKKVNAFKDGFLILASMIKLFFRKI